MTRRKVSVRGDNSGNSSGRGTGSGRSGNPVFPTLPVDSSGLGGPNGKGFGTEPTWQPNSSTSGKFQGDWQQMLNIPVDKLRFNYIDFLIQLLNQKGIPEELRTLIMQQLMQQGVNAEQRSYDWQLTQDQRQYDWNLLQDSRIYNSPTNELARLMGAGISRDAAIQLMSGAAGGSGVGAGSGSPVVGGASQVPLSDTFGNQSLATAQTAIAGVQTVVNMMSQGIDAATAISNAQMMQAQNTMTQSQLQAFKGVNDVTSAFNRAVLDGTLTVEDLQSLRTADDYYRWITDHADTNLVKPLIDNGSVAAVFGSTFGRGMMNNHLENTRLGRDSGQLFDNYLRNTELDADLKDVGLAQNRRDYYVSFATTLNDILASDVELQRLYQSYLNGEKELEINGIRVDLAKYSKAQAARADAYASSEFTAFQNALQQQTTVEQDGRAVVMSGQDILNYNAFSRLIQSYQTNRAITGLHGVLVPDEKGGNKVMSARERYSEMLNANIMVAISGAFIQDCINNNRLAGYSGDLAPIYRFADMWNASGLGSMVQTVGNAIPNVDIDVKNGNYYKLSGGAWKPVP